LLHLQDLAHADCTARNAAILSICPTFEAEHLDTFTFLFGFAALQQKIYQNATVHGTSRTNDACYT